MYDAIVEHPRDDQVRYDYARAIEASDPAHAEFIALQLQLAHWRHARVSPPERDGVQRRQHALRSEHGARWAAHVTDLVAGYTFVRGFVEGVTMPAPRFLQHALELYRRAPILDLTLTDVKSVAAELFASPHLARIRSLGLARNGLGDSEVALVAQSTRLAGLTWLDLDANEIGRAGIEALAASDRLPELRYVGFEGNAIDDPTPRYADAYDVESGLASELQAKYGRRPWLSIHGRASWPPPRDAA